MGDWLDKIADGVFITATDTEVGKTAVAGALARLLVERGWDVGVMKPVASGCRRRRGSWVCEDAECLRQAAQSDDPLDLVNPVRLTAPLAPSVAAAMAQTRVDLRAVRRAYRALRRRHRCVIVEGIGGLLVPITRTRLVADLAVELALPVIVVARATLGTINHTLLTIEAARRRGLRVLGVVVNRYPRARPDAAARTSPAEIERCGGVPVLAVLREDPAVDVARRTLGSLPRQLARQLGLLPCA